MEILLYRDISFLYDVPPDDAVKDKDGLGKDLSKARDVKGSSKPLELPNTLVPDEYHIVKNKGVIGLEYYNEWVWISQASV